MQKVLIAENLDYEYTRIAGKKIGITDIDFILEKGRALGLVGESGSGKSTIAKIICRFLLGAEGNVELLGKSLSSYKEKDYYRLVQYIAQQPQSSFHPKRTIKQSLEEVSINFSLHNNVEERTEAIKRTLESVGLRLEHGEQLPHRLSGGECQRAAIARALLINPTVLVCDEITSALDVTVQAEVMQLMDRIKKEYDTAFLFISHDIALVSNFCEEMIVLKDGEIQEKGDTSRLVAQPQSDYTKLLLSQYKEV